MATVNFGELSELESKRLAANLLFSYIPLQLCDFLNSYTRSYFKSNAGS